MNLSFARVKKSHKCSVSCITSMFFNEYIHTYKHTCKDTYIHTYKYTCKDTHTHTYIHTCTEKNCITLFDHSYQNLSVCGYFFFLFKWHRTMQYFAYLSPTHNRGCATECSNKVLNSKNAKYLSYTARLPYLAMTIHCHAIKRFCHRRPQY